MTYNPAIPQAADLLSVSQADIRNNFSSANTIFGINHYAFNDASAANRGKHKFVEIPQRAFGSGPPPGLVGGQGAVYVSNDTTSAQLFYTNGSSGNEYQLTNVFTGSYGVFGTAVNGWTFLAGNPTQGGLILNYGKVSTPGSAPTSGNVTFSRQYLDVSSIKVFTAPWFQGSGPGGTANFYIDESLTTAIKFFWELETNSSAIDGFYWFAIGV